MEEHYQDCNFSTIVHAFRANQASWRTIKKCIKLVERLTTSQMYSGNVELIKLNVAHLKAREVDMVRTEGPHSKSSEIKGVLPPNLVTSVVNTSINPQLNLFPSPDLKRMEAWVWPDLRR